MRLHDLQRNDTRTYRVLDLENGEYIMGRGPRSGCHLWFAIKKLPEDDWISYELIEVERVRKKVSNSLST